MKVFKMVWADLKIGAWRKVRYLLYAGLMLACCVSIGSLAEAYQVPMRQLSFADCLAYIWQGVYPLIRSSLDDTFMIPPMWLLLMLFTLLMPVDYPVRSMELWGLQYAVRVNKREWWFSKCLYTVIVNIGTFVTGWLVVLIYCLVKGMNISLMNNEIWYENVFCDVTLREQLTLAGWQNLMLLFVCPVLAVWAISLLQLLVAVWMHPFLAYAVSLIILVFSVYSSHFCFLGNYTMTIRSGWIDQDGTDTVRGMIWCAVLGIVIILAGAKAITKKDIIPLKKENE